MGDMAIQWDLVNPEGAARAVTLHPAARLADLTGKTIGLAWNGKPGGDVALEHIAKLLGERVRCIRFWERVPESVSPRELAEPVIRAMAAYQPDLVIVSQGD
jgi:hypothetical protein